MAILERKGQEEQKPWRSREVHGSDHFGSFPPYQP